MATEVHSKFPRGQHNQAHPIFPLLSNQRPTTSSPSLSSWASSACIFLLKALLVQFLIFCFCFAGILYYNNVLSLTFFLRGIIQALLIVIFVSAFMEVRRTLENTSSSQQRLISCRTQNCYLAFALIFYVDTATAILLLSPVYAMILAYLETKTPFTFTDIIAATCTFTGFQFLIRFDKNISDISLENTKPLIGILCVLLQLLLGVYAYQIQRLVGRSILFMRWIYAMSILCTIVTTLMDEVVTLNKLRNINFDEDFRWSLVPFQRIWLPLLFTFLNAPGPTTTSCLCTHCFKCSWTYFWTGLFPFRLPLDPLFSWLVLFWYFKGRWAIWNKFSKGNCNGNSQYWDHS